MGPKDVLSGQHQETEQLKSIKAEVSAAFAEAKRSSPQFSKISNVALVTVNSPCQIHPMIVQIWRTRLAENIVMVANKGYIPGQVNFVVRSARNINLIDFLREHAPPNAGPNYGHGHDRATGGALKYPQCNQFIASLGFGSEAKMDVLA